MQGCWLAWISCHISSGKRERLLGEEESSVYRSNYADARTLSMVPAHDSKSQEWLEQRAEAADAPGGQTMWRLKHMTGARRAHLVGQEEQQPEGEEARGCGRQADGPVDDDGPEEGLQEGVGDAQERGGQREGPGGVEEVVALRVEDGQALHHHRHLAESARAKQQHGIWRHLQASRQMLHQAEEVPGSQGAPSHTGDPFVGTI